MKRRIDYILLIAVLLLVTFGVLMVYSSSTIWAEYKFNDPYKFLKNQALFFFIGIIGMIIVSKIDYKIYKRYANWILLICFILLVLVLIPGIGVVRYGSRSWFGIGSFCILPSEIAKIGLIIFVA